jgi:hypothetical protein
LLWPKAVKESDSKLKNKTALRKPAPPEGEDRKDVLTIFLEGLKTAQQLRRNLLSESLQGNSRKILGKRKAAPRWSTTCYFFASTNRRSIETT